MRETYSPAHKKEKTPVRRGEGLGVEKPKKARLSDTTTERPTAFAPVPNVTMEQRQKAGLDYSGLYTPVGSDIQRDMAKKDEANYKLADKKRISALVDERNARIQREKISEIKAKKLAPESPAEVWWTPQDLSGNGKQRTWKDHIYRAKSNFIRFLGF